MLRENGSTGYEWQVGTIDSSVLELVQTYVAADSTSPAPGSGGTMAMEFNVIGVGTSPLVLNYVRPSDPAGTTPADTFTYTVYGTP